MQIKEIYTQADKDYKVEQPDYDIEMFDADGEEVLVSNKILDKALAKGYTKASDYTQMIHPDGEEILVKNDLIDKAITKGYKRGAKSMTESFVRGTAMGASLGLADEVTGIALGAKDFVQGKGYNYAKNRDESRAEYKKAYADNPGTYTTGQVVGGVTSGIATAGIISPAASIPMAIAEGVGMGAISGFGNSEGDAKTQIQDTLKDAALGGVMGGGFKAVGKGLNKLWNGKTTRVANTTSPTPGSIRGRIDTENEGGIIPSAIAYFSQWPIFANMSASQAKVYKNMLANPKQYSKLKENMKNVSPDKLQELQSYFNNLSPKQIDEVFTAGKIANSKLQLRNETTSKAVENLNNLTMNSINQLGKGDVKNLLKTLGIGGFAGLSGGPFGWAVAAANAALDNPKVMLNITEKMAKGLYAIDKSVPLPTIRAVLGRAMITYKQQKQDSPEEVLNQAGVPNG